MTTDLVANIVNQSEDDLRSIVHEIVGEEATPIGTLTATPIGRSAGHATEGIFRVEGSARDARGDHAWSAIVKVLGKSDNPSPARDYNALQELEVYRSSAFAEVRGGVRAPICYAIQARDHLKLLWLEDLSHTPQPPWQPDIYITTARHVGRFNGYWPEDALPTWEWLTHDGFKTEFTGFPALHERFNRLPSLRDHPIMQHYAPGDAVEALQRFVAECDTLFEHAERTARGVCHRDCHPRNLFPVESADGGYTVAIDWTKVGIDNLGIDLGHMLDSSLLWSDITSAEAAALLEPMLDAYLAGLADVGWAGSEEGVRLTYLTRLACVALRATNLMVHSIDNPKWYAGTEEVFGKPMAEISARFGTIREFAMQCKDEAMQLIV